MRISRTVFAFAVAGALLVSACGDGAEDDADGSATNDVSDYGPTPTLRDNIVAVSPAHGSTVSLASTMSPDPANPNGVCVEVTFENTPQYGQWFRMAVNGEEVTPETTWIIATQENPEDGRLCYAPEEGLPEGRIQAAVSVQDPTNFSAPPRQVVSWAFDVVAE